MAAAASSKDDGITRPAFPMERQGKQPPKEVRTLSVARSAPPPPLACQPPPGHPNCLPLSHCTANCCSTLSCARAAPWPRASCGTAVPSGCSPACPSCAPP